MIARLSTLGVLGLWGLTNLAGQEYHLHLPEGHTAVAETAPCPDGGMFIRYGSTVSRFDAEGALEWTRSYEAIHSLAVANNGVLWAYGSWAWAPGEEEDTAEWTLIVHKVNGMGDVEQTLALRVTAPDDAGLPGETRLIPRVDGGLVVAAMAPTDIIDYYTIFFYVTPEGTGGGMTARMSNDVFLPESQFHEMADGSLVWLRSDVDSPFAPFWYVDHIGPNGEDLMRWRINKTAPAHGVDELSFLLDSDQHILLAYAATALFPEKWLVINKIDLSGNSLWTRAYRTSSWVPQLGPTKIAELTNGRFRLGGADYVELSDTGDILTAFSCSTPIYTDEYVIDEHLLDVEVHPNDVVLYRGVRRWTDPQFGFATTMPLFGRSPNDLGSTCIWECSEPAPLEEQTIPQALFSISNNTDPLPLASPYLTYWVETLPLVVGETPGPLVLGNACELPEFALASVGMADQHRSLGSLGIHPSPIAQGGTLFIEHKDAWAFQVTTASGQLVLTQRSGAGPLHTLSTERLAPGVYFLHALDATQTPLGIARFMVQ